MLRLTDDIYELRAQKDEHLLRGCYFQIKNTNYYITHGFSKKSNKTSIREIYLNGKVRNEDEQE